MNKARRKEIEKVQDEIRYVIDDLGDLQRTCDAPGVHITISRIINELDAAHSYLDDAMD